MQSYIMKSGSRLRTDYDQNQTYPNRFQDSSYYKATFSPTISQTNYSCSICHQSINSNNHVLIQAPDGKILFYPSKQCLNYTNTNNIFPKNSELNFSKYNNLNQTGKNKNINLDGENSISTSQILDLIEKHQQNFQDLEEKLLEIGAELLLRNPEDLEFLKNLIDEAENNNNLNKNTDNYQLSDSLQKRAVSGGMNSGNNLGTTGSDNFNITPRKIIELIKNNPEKYNNLKKVLLERGIESYVNTPEGKKNIKQIIEFNNANTLNKKYNNDENEKKNVNNGENSFSKTQNIDNFNPKDPNNLNKLSPNTISFEKRIDFSDSNQINNNNNEKTENLENYPNKGNNEFEGDHNEIDYGKVLRNRKDINKNATSGSNINNNDNNNLINNDINRNENTINNNMNQVDNNENNLDANPQKDDENNNVNDNNINNINPSNYHINNSNEKIEINNNDNLNDVNNNDNNDFENNNERGNTTNTVKNIESYNDDNEQRNKDENYQNLRNVPNQNNNNNSNAIRIKVITKKNEKNDINDIKGKLYSIKEADELEELNPEFTFEYEYVGRKKKVKIITRKKNKKYPEGRGGKFSRRRK